MKRLLIPLVSGVLMVGTLFIPLPDKRKKEGMAMPMQRSATISLTRRPIPSEPVDQSEAIQPKAESILQPLAQTPLQNAESAKEPSKRDTVAPEAKERPVSFLQDLQNHQTEEPAVAMASYHELNSTIRPPVFDVALLSSLLEYPPIAKRQNKDGVVRLRLFIEESGVIERMVIEQDPGYGLAEATIKAFEQLNPLPATQDGVPIAVTMVFPVRWQLQY